MEFSVKLDDEPLYTQRASYAMGRADGDPGTVKVVSMGFLVEEAMMGKQRDAVAEDTIHLVQALRIASSILTKSTWAATSWTRMMSAFSSTAQALTASVP